MSWPQQKSPSHEDRRATAPYNFVPLPERVYWAYSNGDKPPPRDKLDPACHHGTIDLEIVTETATYTRCASTGDREEAHFYHHGDPSTPVIPGATIRGMLRALVQVMGYGRFTRFDDDGATGVLDRWLVYRAVADQQTPTGKAYNQRFLRERPRGDKRGPRAFDYPGPGVKAGYLRQAKGGWEIEPAVEHQGVSFVRVSTKRLPGAGIKDEANHLVRPVYVKPAPVRGYQKPKVELYYARTDEIQKRPAEGLVEAALVMSGAIGSRHMHTAVYAPDPKAKRISIPPGMWELFHEDNTAHRGLPCRTLSAGDPCFYLVEQGKLIFFGPTLFFRVLYDRRTASFIPEASAPRRHDRNEDLDLAEALFGVVGGETIVRGRVEVEDAVMSRVEGGGGPFFGENGGRRTPAILSTPKPTSYQHYLVQTDPSGEKGVLHGYSSDPDKTMLRGHKRYWHRGEPTQDDLAPRDKDPGDTQRTLIRPVRRGVVFRGRIRFENLSDIELGALLTAVELRPEHRHQLGLGKPLGLGTVKLNASVTLIDPKEKYVSLGATGALSANVRDEALKKAKESFQGAIIEHYKTSVERPKLDDSDSIWQIPRLSALDHLLRWDGRPAPRATQSLGDPKNFRERRVLPTPGFVTGKGDPAQVVVSPKEPSATIASSLGVETNVVLVKSAAPRAQQGPVVKRGEILRFAQTGVLVRLDGESKPRKVPLSLSVFPQDRWKKLNGVEIRPGRAVWVDLRGEDVVRIVPADAP